MSGQHLVIAADTWQPWFLITEEEEESEGQEGGKSSRYSGIMWEVG